jgi:3-hydroxyisobutyrate dehydrogenase
VDGVGEFIGKDVAVVRKITAELGSDLGLLDDVINAGIRP